MKKDIQDKLDKALKKEQPPLWAERFLAWFCHPDLLPEIEGDLQELFERWVKEYGVRKARWVYIWQVLTFFRPFAIKKERSNYRINHTMMFRNYFTITLRALWRYKGYTTLNILGLAIGMASFFLIALYVYHEWSYDRYHQNADRIYRVVENLRTENEELYQSTSSMPMGPALASEFPEVTDFVRLWQVDALIEKGDAKFYEENVYLADSSVFDIFSFPMLEGNPDKALTAPQSIVLTETAARKYFGEEEALGQSLIVNNNACKVTGVVANVPENSHFTFNILISFTSYTVNNREAEERAWFWNDFHTYLLLAPGENQVENLRAKMPGFIEKYIGKESTVDMYYDELPLQPLTSIYLGTPRRLENGVRGSKSNMYILSVIALFILLIACFNYVNLATARSSHRMKEVALRKVVGAGRKMLIVQFLGESIMVSLFSMLLGMLLAVVLLPVFNRLLETSLTLQVLHHGYVWAGVLLLSLLLGILAGSYPAFLVSGFHPLVIFRRSPQSVFGHNRLRQVLVSGQFVISITLIAGTLLIYDQLSLLKNQNLGFDKEKMLTINYNGNEEVNQRLASIKNELQQVPGIKAVSASSTVPGRTTNNQGAVIEMVGGEMSRTNINTYRVDHDFIPEYGISVIAGRAFSRDYPADDTTAFMINEAAAKNFGWTSPEMAVGKKIDKEDRKGTIVGVVQDFHYKSLHHMVEPLLILMEPYYNVISLKIQSDDIPAVIAEAEAQWKTLTSGLPFDYSFLDQDYDRLYKAEQQLSKVVGIFSSLAIFVACLGLLGLTAFAVERRFKEIGIRKVLGASVAHVVLLITKEFVWLILISMALAVPITLYVIHLWLENFTNRIEIGPLVFVIAGCSTLLIAWLTVSFQSIKAALANPVDSLRNE